MKFLLDEYGTLIIDEEDWPDNEKDALELSIKKWEAALELRPETCGSGSTCALCHLLDDYRCAPCLIYRVTGEISCAATPYRDTYEDRTKDGKIRVKHIKAEIKFLKSLRPLVK